MYSGTWPTAEPMPRSLMPCGQPKLSSTPSAPVSSTSGRIAFQLSSSHGTISETTSARSGQSRLTCLISRRLTCSGRSVISSMLLKPSSAPVGAADRAVARAVDVDDRRAFLAERLPDHAAPARLEGADDVVGLVGRRRRGQPERVGRLDADEVVAEVGHAHALPFERAVRGGSHSAASLAVLRRRRRSGRRRRAMQSPPAQTLAATCGLRRRPRCGRPASAIAGAAAVERSPRRSGRSP